MVVLRRSTATNEPTTMATHIATNGTSEREYTGAAIALTVARGSVDRAIGAGSLGAVAGSEGTRTDPERRRATR
jgi:hypothetical protein